MAGAWKYPPRRRPWLARNRWFLPLILAALVALAAAPVVGRAIAQAAYDAVNFETMEG